VNHDPHVFDWLKAMPKRSPSVMPQDLADDAAANGQRVQNQYVHGPAVVIEMEGINGQDVAVSIMPQVVQESTGPGGDKHLLCKRCTVLRYRGISFDVALRAFEPEPAPASDHMPPAEEGETLDDQIRLLRADLSKLIARAATDTQTAGAWEIMRDRAELLIRLLATEQRQLKAELAAAGAAVAAGGTGGD
jgi:hypothetical protein